MTRIDRKLAAALLVTALLAGCASTPRQEGAASRPTPPARSGYYQDDGPADSVPAELDSIPDAVPRREPLHRFANRPYTVLGRDYVPATALRPYRERGMASWYGRKFHDQKTSTGETYDMFAMTAAHPTLPLPSYARVTSLATGRSVVVRVNDRGPFLNDRVIDLSYAAAHRIGIAQKGTGEVEVEAIVFEDVYAAAGPAPVATSSRTVSGVTAPAAPASAAARASEAAPALAQAGRATAAPPALERAIASTPAGTFVQLGAFASFANAQAFLAHVANQLSAVGVEGHVRQVNGLFRVFVGPYATRDEARTLAERLRTELRLASTVTTP